MSDKAVDDATGVIESMPQITEVEAVGRSQHPSALASADDDVSRYYASPSDRRRMP